VKKILLGLMLLTSIPALANLQYDSYGYVTVATDLSFELEDKVVEKETGRHGTIVDRDETGNEYTVQFKNGAIWKGALAKELMYLRGQQH
jgi:hypothetical protein